jgi:hypothetical protein
MCSFSGIVKDWKRSKAVRGQETFTLSVKSSSSTYLQEVEPVNSAIEFVR